MGRPRVRKPWRYSPYLLGLVLGLLLGLCGLVYLRWIVLRWISFLVLILGGSP